ncbi:MAG: hypothetical protein WA655_14585 [Candidatus Korobacteraceae bacterium]
MKLQRALFFAAAITVLALATSAAGLPQARDNEAPPDTWGGLHVSMQMTAEGATLQFDCAQGEIQQPIKPNASGAFSVPGTYTPQRGGPVQKDNPPRDLPAIYKGTIHGDTMQLEIVLDDKSQAPESLTLTRGKTGRVVQCR